MYDPPFQKVAIIGIGLIGGSIALGLRRTMPGVRLTGVDRPGVLHRARRMKAIHDGSRALARGLVDADLVILATPVDAAIAMMPEIARFAPKAAIITDVAGTKLAIMKAARRAGLGDRFVGGHPMGGSERSGLAHADASMFRGVSWILCPAAARRRRIEGCICSGKVLGDFLKRADKDFL